MSVRPFSWLLAALSFSLPGAIVARAQTVYSDYNISYHWRSIQNGVTISPIPSGSDATVSFAREVPRTVDPSYGSVQFGDVIGGHVFTVSYYPITGFTGTDTFTLTLEDLFGERGTLKFNLAATNTLPVAGSITANVGALETGVRYNLLAASSDADGDPIRFTSFSAALTGYGTLAQDPDVAGWVIYTRNANAPATAYTSTFSFQVNDGNRYSSSTGTFTLNVSAVPEPATYAIALGGCALGLAAWRRRRSRS